MIVRGKVIGINQQKGIVTILTGRPSSCAHGCENCSSCVKADTQIIVTSRRSCNIGDFVEAEVSDKPPIAALAVVYLFPIVMLFIIYIVASMVEAIWAISAIIIIGAMITYVVLKLINKAFKDRIQGEIINLIKNEKST